MTRKSILVIALLYGAVLVITGTYGPTGHDVGLTSQLYRAELHSMLYNTVIEVKIKAVDLVALHEPALVLDKMMFETAKAPSQVGVAVPADIITSDIRGPPET